MRLSGCLAATTILAICGAPQLAPARPSKAKHRVHATAADTPSADGLDLGYLAPPTRLTTLRQDYGDAAFARSRYNRGYPAEVAADRRQEIARGTPYPCDPRVARADAYVCGSDQRHLGYGQYFAFTPSYVSSPQVVAADPNAQNQVLPPVTAIFWAVNGLRYDPHN